MKEKVVTFFREYRKSFVVVFSLLAICVAISVITSVAVPKKLKVSFLDIGQGDSILIQTPGGHEMLIDGGPNDGVLGKLHREMSYFNHDIDVVVATHGDADHVTGLIPVLEVFDVEHIVRSPIDAHTGIFDDLTHHMDEETRNLHVAQAGDKIDFGDGVIAYVLYPTKSISPKTETNDASVCVVIMYGAHSFLLTGDLSSKFESKLIAARGPLVKQGVPLQDAQLLPQHVTVYKAGHHGSKTSSGASLLTYIKPEYAVISAGRDNKYGHPNEETLTRLQMYAQEILSTIDRGTITFISDGRLLEVETEK